MSEDPRSRPEPLLEIPGIVADHLYREGSSKASFWEAIFGSSLRAKHRTHVSALADGTRMFDVPLLELEPALLSRVQAFLTSGTETGERQAGGLITSKAVRVKLLGLQPRGQAVAAFSLRFEGLGPSGETPVVLMEAFRAWFKAEGAAITRELLIPFGFTPR